MCKFVHGEQRLRCIRGSLGCVSRDDTTILHTFLSAPACTVCTDMVYSKKLERDVTTIAMAKAMLRLKALAFIASQNMIGSIIYVQRRHKGCHAQAMCKMLLF